MLYVWWCSGGLVHYELIPAGKTVNMDLYCRQLASVMEKFAPTFRKNEVAIPAMPPSRQRGTPHSEGDQGNPRTPWLLGLTPDALFS